MKKLMAMIGAVAMSFGLFADDATPTSFSISFEAAESAKGVSEGTFTPPTGWTWDGDPLALSQYASEVLPYGNPLPARRDDMFTGLADNNYYLPLETGTDELVREVGEDNLCLDQLVKFTGFEDPQTNLTGTAKIAIWMSEFENDDESTETNLFVTVGKVTGAGVEQIKLAINTNDNYKLNTWYRLTVKSIGGIYSSAVSDSQRAGFLVWINGKPAVCDDEAAKSLTTYSGEMSALAAKYMAQGRLFTAIDATDATFAQVGYQGIGAVDDIILDDVGPGFTVETVDVGFTTIEGAIIATVTDAEGVVEQNEDGTYSVKPGALTVTLAADEGYKLSGTLTYGASTDDAEDGVIDIAAEDTEAAEVVATLTDSETTTDLAERELAAALAALGEDEFIMTVKSCAVMEGEEEEQTTLYSFTPNTTITGTATGWSIYVGDYEEEGIPSVGILEFYVGVAADSTLAVELENPTEGMFMFAGEVAGTLTAEVLIDGGGITLSGEGKVITTDGTLEITDDLSNPVTPIPDTPQEGWYTYVIGEPPAPTVDTVTFTVTYDDTQVENVTVKTNGADVVDALGVYTVKSNEVVTVAATAKTGYQNVTITGDNVTVVDGVFTASEAETEITITAEEIPTPGFKIIISGIDAADVTEDATTITIVTEAQPLVYIDGAAATVAGEAGAWTVTKPAITADTAISIVKATTIPAVGHKWYENPTLMGKVTVAYGTDGCGGWNGAKDLAGDYIAAAFGYSGLSAVVTKISDLVAGNGGEVAPIAVYPATEVGGSLRGAGISTALGVTIYGSYGIHEITVISLDGATTNKVTTSNGVIPDSFWFSDDGQFLYANGYEEVSGDSTVETAIRQNVYKYAIVDNLIGDGEKLVLAETYTVGQRVRGMTKFGDVILARTDDGYYAIDLSVAEPAFAKVGAGGKCDDVVIAGGHFYHLSSSTGILSIYNLNTAGTWYEGEAIATYNVANVLGCRVSDTGNNFFVTPNEETLVFCETVAQTPQVVKAFQWTLPTYDITFAATLNGTLETSVTNDIAAGTTVTVTANPVTGYECTQITTNGTAITGTSFDMPADDVEIGATFALQQFTVAAITVENATAVATNTATETGLDLPATVDYNTAIAVTVTPNSGYEYKTTPDGWNKNTNGSITTNAMVTADLAITVEAPTKAAADPVDPEVPTHYNTTKEAEDAAKAINDNKATMIKTPTGAVAEDYTALFKAVVTANNDVIVELTEDGTNALETAATTIETAVANKLGNIAAAAAGGDVEVVVTGVEPGFWYGVAATADLTTMGASQPGEWKQATTEGVTLTVTKPTTGNAAFFQTRAKVK